MNRVRIVLCLSTLLGACASKPSLPVPPVPEQLKPAVGETMMSVVAARGVQIYQCRAKKGKPAAGEWTFVAPEADLLDSVGKVIGKHYAGPHWEAVDGSKIVGMVEASIDAPQGGAIPWLLLRTRPDGGNGVFTKVTSVQRLDTIGGLKPAEGCSKARFGTTVRIPYAADYVMYAASIGKPG